VAIGISLADLGIEAFSKGIGYLLVVKVIEGVRPLGAPCNRNRLESLHQFWSKAGFPSQVFGQCFFLGAFAPTIDVALFEFVGRFQLWEAVEPSRNEQKLLLT